MNKALKKGEFLYNDVSRMNNLELITLSENYKQQYLKFVEKNEDDLRKTGFYHGLMPSDGESFEEFVNKVTNRSEGIGLPNGWVPENTCFIYNETENEIAGGVLIRHYITESLLRRSGHIGYYICTKSRNRGFAKLALTMALEICRKLKIFKVLVTCSKVNIASAKVIVANGGVLENKLTEDNGEVFQRYWIEL